MLPMSVVITDSVLFSLSDAEGFMLIDGANIR